MSLYLIRGCALKLKTNCDAEKASERRAVARADAETTAGMSIVASHELLGQRGESWRKRFSFDPDVNVRD